MTIYNRLRFIFCLIVLVITTAGCTSLKRTSEWQAFKAQENELDAIQVGDVRGIDSNDTLDDLVQKALLNNEGLQSFFSQWKAALLNVSKIKNLPDPVLSYSNYIESVETRVGPQKQALGIMQKIPFVGKLDAKGKKALAKASAFGSMYQEKKWKVIYELKVAYYEYAYLKQAIKITEENEKLLRYFEQVVQTKYKSGNAKNQDLLKVQVELGKIADKLISLTDSKSVVEAKLNAALSLPMSKSVMLSDTSVDYPDPKDSLDKEALIDKLSKYNPHLANLSFQIEAAKQDVSLAKLQFFPDLSVGATYIETDNGPLNVSDNGKDPVILMFKMNLPIWYDGLTHSLTAAREMVSAKQNMFENDRLNLQAKLEFILYRLNDAMRKIQLYDDSLIPKATQSLKATEATYKAGGTDFLNVIDAQRMLLDFKLSNARAKADWAERVAELEMLLGRSLT